MQKVKVSPCGEHLYAEPVATPLLFVLLHPPSRVVESRLYTLALANGYNGYAVTWLYSARVHSRSALMAVAPGSRSTATHAEKLRASVGLAVDVVAAWGGRPKGDPLPECLQSRNLLCMGLDLLGNPICPAYSGKFKEYVR